MDQIPIEEMDRSDEQWQSIFDSVKAELDSSSDSKPTSNRPRLTPEQLAPFIDHTILKLDATEEQVDKLCEEAKHWHFAAICVRENFVARAKKSLQGTNIHIACVVGFHEGTQPTVFKLEEASRAIAAGATELDMVLNRDLLKQKQYAAVYEELKAMRDVVPEPVELKLILETSELDKAEVVYASVLAGYAGWDYIKTSSGFCGRGASVEDVRLMKQLASILGKTQSKEMKVKASGGIRSFKDAMDMIVFGANRIGASAGVAMMEEAVEKSK
ncbi:deoxyribose-phosphate aldolase [Microthyrium microscopicum]|uniref:deoxyribose-phosphate aldolase n=1 Tax=Microthyrium microscopicum TaxID=703497 RepID=A0A6A6UW25_9PEZI|nr:deoxyribose-phosphate aldolase [Microthyrium microscopicum]